MRLGRACVIAGMMLGAVALANVLRAPAPVVAESSAVRRGGELFAGKGCAHCHGEAGFGGMIGPDLSDVRKRLKPEEIREQIVQGGHGMPAYGDQLSEAEISDLVAYLRSKRKPVSAPTAPAPAPASP